MAKILFRTPFSLQLHVVMFLAVPAILQILAIGQERFVEIEVIGNDALPSSEIRQTVHPVLGSFLVSGDRKILENPLLQLYHQRGYLFCEIDSIIPAYQDSVCTSVSIYLREGAVTQISQLGLNGNEKLTTEELLSLCSTRIGSPLVQRDIESDLDRILRHYENSGYPFASIKVDSIRFDSENSNQLAVVFKIQEGPKIVLTEIRPLGNLVTKSDVIVREAGFMFGKPFRESDLSLYRRRLQRLGLFSTVSDPTLFVIGSGSTSERSAGGIQIEVKEKSFNSFNGILGYQPASEPSGKGQIVGTVAIQLNNLFGTARALSVNWRRENISTQEIRLAYREPWLLNYPVDGEASFFQRKQDSLYVKNSIATRFAFRLSIDFSAGVFIEWNDVYPSSQSNSFTVFESRATTLGGDLRYDTRDHPTNPREGILYSAAYQWGQKNITGPQSFLNLASQRHITLERYTLDLEYFFPVVFRQTIASKLHGRRVTASSLDISDLFQLGGTYSLRGYRENQFYGSDIAWINLEYRFIVGDESSVYAFLDGGYVHRPTLSAGAMGAFETWKHGKGVGLQVVTGLGRMTVNYGLGEGDTFQRGKIHIGLMNEF